MNNEKLVEKRFLNICGYTLEEAERIMEGFGVTDPVLPEGEPTDPAKAKASAQYNQLLSLLSTAFRGKIPPEIAKLTLELKRYFSGEPVASSGNAPQRGSQIAKPSPKTTKQPLPKIGDYFGF